MAETSTLPAAPAAPFVETPAAPIPLPVYTPDFSPEIERLKPVVPNPGRAFYR